MAGNKPRASTLNGHAGPVSCVDFCRSKSGIEYIVTGGEDAKIIIWPQGVNERTKKLSGHTGAVTAMKCHGDWIISVSKDKTLRVTWNWASNVKEPRSRFVTAHSGPISCLDVHPSEKIATGSYDKSVKLFDLSSLRFRRSITNHRGIVTGVAFSEEGTLLATVGSDRNILVHDLAAQTVLCDLLSPEKSLPTCVTFALNCDSFLVGFSDGKVRLYDPPEGGELLQVYSKLHSNAVSAVEFSSFVEGTFVSVSKDCTIAVVDALEGSAKAILNAGAPVHDLVLSKTRENKLCVVTDPKVELWEVNLKSAQKLGLNPVTARSFDGDELDVTVGQVEEMMTDGLSMGAKAPRPPRRSNFTSRAPEREANGAGGDYVSREDYEKLRREFARLQLQLDDVKLERDSLKAKIALSDGFRK